MPQLGGLSILIHLFIILAVLIKKLVNFVFQKLHWEISRFKMNLYLWTGFKKPLTTADGDSFGRKFLSYVIVLATICLIAGFAVFVININQKLTVKNNLDLIIDVIRLNSAVAGPPAKPVAAAKLPLSENTVRDLPASPKIPAIR